MWWNSLSVFQKIYFCVAVLFTAILVVQMILMIVGAGSDGGDGIDLDGDGDPDINVDGDSGLSLFTIKGIVAFFAVGGWTGFALGDGMMKEIYAALISVAAGLVALVLVGLLMKWIIGLSSNGNMNLDNAVGKVAEVYLTIPPKCTSKGKITVEVQGQLMELEAMTEAEEPIATGSKVRVVKNDGGICVVEKV